MERVPIQGSSQVVAAGFHEPVMEVEFKARKGENPVYQYRNVTRFMWADFLNAPSKGRWIAENLKRDPQRFPYQRVH